MSLGGWNINVSDKMPQKVATAFGNLHDQLLGAKYTFIAYLGSQSVNGVNHAVLAEQLVISGEDTKNVVVIIFNERGMDCNVVNIERVVESGGELGGIQIDVKTQDIPDEAQQAFDSVIEGFVGSKVEPFVYLGSQVTKGTNYIFAATVTPVVPDAESKVSLVVVNSMTCELAISDMLGTKHEAMALGYAFTWLKRQNTSLGAPLGEWP